MLAAGRIRWRRCGGDSHAGRPAEATPTAADPTRRNLLPTVGDASSLTPTIRWSCSSSTFASVDRYG
ncbi:unnamed protein product [Angiostrongylus costaricensis]|uniref:Uncharacterized protein n=1 Tax=Angiostrongylus costaricensis TaxID=334426 RepID=A0A0R3P9Z4_ANGCS|nr:unnamed protein product [Angiostrongylus costaricensis]